MNEINKIISHIQHLKSRAYNNYEKEAYNKVLYFIRDMQDRKIKMEEIIHPLSPYEMKRAWNDFITNNPETIYEPSGTL